MNLDYLHDLLFDLVNECDKLDIYNIVENCKEHTLWLIMKDGSIFRIQSGKEAFSLYQAPVDDQETLPK